MELPTLSSQEAPAAPVRQTVDRSQNVPKVMDHLRDHGMKSSPRAGPAAVDVDQWIVHARFERGSRIGVRPVDVQLRHFQNLHDREGWISAPGNDVVVSGSWRTESWSFGSTIQDVRTADCRPQLSDDNPPASWNTCTMVPVVNT